MLYGVKTKVESYHEDVLSYFLNKIDRVMFAWWFICKVTQWSHNAISVELLRERFIGFLFILNASKRHRRFSGLTFSFTICKIWKGNHVRIIIKKINVCHYHWTATVSFKWITIIVAKKKKSIYSQPSENCSYNKKINTVWFFGDKYNMPFNSGFVTLTLEVHPASVGIMLGSWREHQPLLWQ